MARGEKDLIDKVGGFATSYGDTKAGEEARGMLARLKEQATRQPAADPHPLLPSG